MELGQWSWGDMWRPISGLKLLHSIVERQRTNSALYGRQSKATNRGRTLPQAVGNVQLNARFLDFQSLRGRAAEFCSWGKECQILWDDLRERFLQGNETRIHQLKIELKQDRKSVSEYYSKLKSLWDGLELYLDLSACTCDASAQIAAQKENEKVHQFLIGLNPEFSIIRSQILSIDPLSNVNRAHSMAALDEAQRLIAQRRDSSSEVMGFAAKVAIDSEGSNPNFSSNRGDFKPRAPLLPELKPCEPTKLERKSVGTVSVRRKLWVFLVLYSVDARRREFRVRFIQFRTIEQALFGQAISDASGPTESWAMEAQSVSPAFLFPESSKPYGGPGPGPWRIDSGPQQVSTSL
ncbi:hypothetical protein CRG98_029067 [Punica granatum]|uniref:Uncharacterized protein n=1 Tax=Punica granatum TaxID=22663 RepID=A0A2I0J2V5_PUNGR|nr:hypothetical protein CRG98_029067 [Punica granatum]